MTTVGHNLTNAEIALRYSDLAGTLGLPDAFYQTVVRFVAFEGRRLRIVDVGCGNGELLAHILAWYPDSLIIGTEVAHGRLRWTREHVGSHVCLVEVNAGTPFPFRDAMLDVTFLTEVIEHVKDPQLFLTELHRVMRSTGTLILTTPSSDAYIGWPMFAWIVRHITSHRWVTHFLPYEHPLRTKQPIDRILSFHDVQALLHCTGWRPIRVVGHGALPFLFTLPGFPTLERWGILSRSRVDAFFNWAGLHSRCAHVLWECMKSQVE